MRNFIDEAFRLRKELDLWIDIVGIPFDRFLKAGIFGIAEIHSKKIDRANAIFADQISCELNLLPKDVVMGLCLSAAYLDLVIEMHEESKLCNFHFLNMAAEEIGFCHGANFGLVRANERRRVKLSDSGKKGAKSLHRPKNELKAWALSEAKSIRSSHKDIARKLVTQIPKHLVDASKDPERLIYDALRAQKPI